MTPSPIIKVLSTIQNRRVRFLLMGGQACILYGAAEFSRDLDLVVLADENNLDRLRQALEDLEAEPVYVLPLGQGVLQRGHACHFRAGIPEALGVRIDVMSVLRGCKPFPVLWARRRRMKLPQNGLVNVLALTDLVQAKKTQQDKDWPMLGRLVEVDYHQRPRRPTQSQIAFWLREGRSPALLIELCHRFPRIAQRLIPERPLLRWAIHNDTPQTEQALRDEENQLRAEDRAWWQPLKEELFQWRQRRRRPQVPNLSCACVSRSHRLCCSRLHSREVRP